MHTRTTTVESSRETRLITATRELARKGWILLPNPWNSEYLNRRPRQPGSKVYRERFGLSLALPSLITSPWRRFRPLSIDKRRTDFRAAETGKAQTERDAILDSLLHRFKFAALIIRFERFSGDVSSGTKTRGEGDGVRQRSSAAYPPPLVYIFNAALSAVFLLVRRPLNASQPEKSLCYTRLAAYTRVA